MFPPRVQRGIELGVEAHRKGYLDPTRLQAVLTYYDREGALDPPEPEMVLQRIGGLTTGQLTDLLGVAAEPVEGTRFTDRLSLLEPLGEGAMGAVYRAWDRVLKRTVAVKVIKPDRLDAANATRLLARFEREAEAMARVRHPACVPIFDAGVEKEGGRPYIVMGLVAGKSLRQLIAEHGSLDWRRVAAWGHDLALALQACHDVGVVHRDVKPANVLIDAQDRPFLTDFGVALDDQARTKLTAEQAAVGTLAYMAPEQATGHPVDARVDVYALGATLYEATTGRAPFEATHALVLIRQIVEAEPEPLRRLAPQAPADLDAVLQQALAKSRDDRYATAQALALDLGRLLSGEAVLARRSGTTPLGRWARRRRVPLIIGSVAMASSIPLGLGVRALRSHRLRSEALAAIEAAAIGSDLIHSARQLARYELVDDVELVRAIRTAQDDLRARELLTLGRASLEAARQTRLRALEIDEQRRRLETEFLQGPLAISSTSLTETRRVNLQLRVAERKVASLLDAAARAATNAETLRAADANRLLADVLAERLELQTEAEQADLAEEIRRLDPLHPSIQPAHVEIDGSPPARCDVYRLTYDLDSGRMLEREIISGRTPLGCTLPPADYVVRWTTDAHLPVRRCLRVVAGRPRRLSVGLIPSASLGALTAFDVVHVPGGTARYGDRLRSGKVAKDLLLQRNETDLDAWRSFLLVESATQRPRPTGAGQFPAGSVTFREADRYAVWVSENLRLARSAWIARLPSYEELAWALRGEFGWAFPWGPTLEPTFFANSMTSPKGVPSSDRFPDDRTWAGIRGLAGGCVEWIQPSPAEPYRFFGASPLTPPDVAASQLLNVGHYAEDLRYDANTVRLVFEPCPLPDLVTDRPAAQRHSDAAMHHEASNQLFEAQKAWTQAIEAAPLDPTLWQRRGACRLNRGDLWGAHWDFSRALAIGSEHDEINLYNRAFVQLQRGLPDEAAADAAKALEKRPDWVDALLLLGRIQTAKADHVAARVTLQRALRLAPDAATEGRVRQRLAELDEAERKQPR